MTLVPTFEVSRQPLIMEVYYKKLLVSGLGCAPKLNASKAFVLLVILSRNILFLLLSHILIIAYVHYLVKCFYNYFYVLLLSYVSDEISFALNFTLLGYVVCKYYISSKYLRLVYKIISDDKCFQ